MRLVGELLVEAVHHMLHRVETKVGQLEETRWEATAQLHRRYDLLGGKRLRIGVLVVLRLDGTLHVRVHLLLGRLQSVRVVAHHCHKHTILSTDLNKFIFFQDHSLSFSMKEAPARYQYP